MPFLSIPRILICPNAWTFPHWRSNNWYNLSWRHWCQSKSSNSVLAITGRPPTILEEMTAWLFAPTPTTVQMERPKIFGVNTMVVLKEENLPSLRWRLDCIVGCIQHQMVWHGCQYESALAFSPGQWPRSAFYL